MSQVLLLLTIELSISAPALTPFAVLFFPFIPWHRGFIWPTIGFCLLLLSTLSLHSPALLRPFSPRWDPTADFTTRFLYPYCWPHPAKFSLLSASEFLFSLDNFIPPLQILALFLPRPLLFLCRPPLSLFRSPLFIWKPPLFLCGLLLFLHKISLFW